MPPRTRKAAFDPEAAGAEQRAQKKVRTPPADRSLHNAVAKKLRDNFKSWPAVAIDGTLRDGLTLRQTLTADVQNHSADPAALPMGSSYYANLREKFKQDAPDAQKFHVKHAEDPVSPAPTMV